MSELLPVGGTASERSSAPWLVVASLLLVAAGLPGCSEATPRDEGRPDADDGDTVDAAADVADDGDDPSADGSDAADGRGGGPGPIAMVVNEAALTDDRTCDFDGDGQGDNAIADLGSPFSEMMLGAINATTLQGDIDAGRHRRTVFYFPWVEDRAGPSDPEALVLQFSGEDTDDPPNPEDDFSGAEPMHADWRDIDICGEPLTFGHGTLDEGDLQGTFGATTAMFGGLPFSGGQFSGEIEPYGVAAEIFMCGYLSIRALGEDDDLGGDAGLTSLEMLLSGGSSFGIPTLPGLLPNVDVDGDGLERFTTDDEGLIVSCIDGDRTEIPGRDCWMDDRIADAFGMAITARALSIVFAGREPDWEERVEIEHGECTDPPEESLWDWR